MEIIKTKSLKSGFILLFSIICFSVYIQSCSKDNFEDPILDNNCDTTSVSYIKDIKPLFESKCNSCHSGSSAPRGIKTDNYNDVKSNFSSILGAVEHKNGFSAMPQGSAKLSDCNINKLNRWNNLGKPDN